MWRMCLRLREQARSHNFCTHTQNPRRTQIHCGSNRRLRRSRSGGSVASLSSDPPPSRASSLLQFSYQHPNPRRTQIHCGSNRRLRRSRSGGSVTSMPSDTPRSRASRPTHGASAIDIELKQRASCLIDYFHGAGSPNSRPCTPSIPISRITRCSPSVSTRSAISGRSMLWAARWTASMNKRL